MSGGSGQTERSLEYAAESSVLQRATKDMGSPSSLARAREREGSFILPFACSARDRVPRGNRALVPHFADDGSTRLPQGGQGTRQPPMDEQARRG